MLFDMLFQGKNDALSRDTDNKYLVINVILTERKKPGCNVCHLHDADIIITKLSGQSSLKSFIIEISENKDLLVLCIMQAIIQNHVL